MEINDISRLASYLRDHGDLILNSASKLTLTAQLLHKLNEAFLLIVENEANTSPSSFQVITTNNSKFEFFHDLAFLHDFVQKTVRLKVTNLPPKATDSYESLDISKFKLLQHLELTKIPINMVSGIQCLQNQLDTLICIRCLGKLEDILKYCGSDQSLGSLWSELRKAVFSYNALESLDQSILFIPWLQVLDLSHNRLTNADLVLSLPNLKCLNLSYNLIQAIPTYNKNGSHELVVLVIKFNYIEDLSGLLHLINLKDLDLSCNCLMEHAYCLQPIAQLSSLAWLSLEGNPLSYHKKHRIRTAQYLHNNTINRKFLLDSILLSRSERLAVGTLSSRVGVEPISRKITPGPQFQEEIDVPKIKPQASRKSTRVREAIISEHGELEQDLKQDLSTSVQSNFLEMSTEYLETKKQIETLREHFGEENWLHSHGGSFVQDILGIPQSPKPAAFSLTKQFEDKASIMHQQILASSSNHTKDSLSEDNIIDQNITGKIAPNEITMSGDGTFDSKYILQEAPDHIVKDSSFVIDDDGGDDDDDDDDGDDDDDDGDDDDGGEGEGDKDEVDDEDDDEREEHVYAVQGTLTNNEREELFLVVTKLHIKEREIRFGKTREKWTIQSLISCIRLLTNPTTVQLAFDTIRRSRQERCYIMEEEDAQNILQTLGTVLSTRSLSAMHQTVYHCLNCSTEFSNENDTWSLAEPSQKCHTCPNCKRSLGVQMDNAQTKYAIDFEDNSKGNTLILNNENNSKMSSSMTSIGADRSLKYGPNANVRSLEIGSGDTSTLTICSAASFDQSLPLRRSDSDIEIISNPSQSSIEILDDKGTPSRKNSSLESAVPVPRAHLLSLTGVTGLTESSSSGSFTDSICTTYENRYSSSVPRSNSNVNIDTREESAVSEEIEKSDMKMTVETLNSSNCCSIKDSESSTETLEDTFLPTLHIAPSSVTILPNMIEDLFHTVSSKLSRSPASRSVVNPEQTTNIAVTYSYEDYAQVDHRLKLHLYLHIFEEEQEELILLIRANILIHTNSSCYLGCAVLSNRKVYFLKFIGQEGENIDLWLKKSDSIPLEKLETISPLPWNQGIVMNFKDATYLILLKDKLRTANLLTFLSGIPLPENCLCVSPAKPLQAIEDLLASVTTDEGNSENICSHLSIFNQSKIINDSVINNHTLGIIIVTKTNLIMCKDNLQWLLPLSVFKPVVLRSQKMSNLFEVEVALNYLTLHFQDDTIERNELWVINMETVEELKKVVLSIKDPWEELFLIPLQITDATNSLKL